LVQLCWDLQGSLGLRNVLQDTKDVPQAWYWLGHDFYREDTHF